MNHKMNQIDYETLMLRYLEGETTSEERALLLDWLKEDSRHLKNFVSLRHAYTLAKQSMVGVEYDSEKAYAEFEKAVFGATSKTNKRYFSPKFMWVAASIISILMLTTGIYKLSNGPKSVILGQSFETPCQVSLADGTVVILQKHSVIYSSTDFNKKNRNLSFHGEAFFKVKHNSAMPFVIDANGMFVKDIGTEFTVVADSVTKQTSVDVKEGVVAVKYAGKAETLHAGEAIKTDAMHKTLASKEKKNKVQKASDLVFDNTPLNEVVSTLNKKYQVQFKIMSPMLDNCHLNATFDENSDIKDVTQSLSLVLGVRIVESKGQLLIYSK